MSITPLPRTFLFVLASLWLSSQQFFVSAPEWLTECQTGFLASPFAQKIETLLPRASKFLDEEVDTVLLELIDHEDFYEVGVDMGTCTSLEEACALGGNRTGPAKEEYLVRLEQDIRAHAKRTSDRQTGFLPFWLARFLSFRNLLTFIGVVMVLVLLSPFLSEVGRFLRWVFGSFWTRFWQAVLDVIEILHLKDLLVYFIFVVVLFVQALYLFCLDLNGWIVALLGGLLSASVMYSDRDVVLAPSTTPVRFLKLRAIIFILMFLPLLTLVSSSVVLTGAVYSLCVFVLLYDVDIRLGSSSIFGQEVVSLSYMIIGLAFLSFLLLVPEAQLRSDVRWVSSFGIIWSSFASALRFSTSAYDFWYRAELGALGSKTLRNVMVYAYCVGGIYVASVASNLNIYSTAALLTAASVTLNRFYDLLRLVDQTGLIIVLLFLMGIALIRYAQSLPEDFALVDWLGDSLLI